MAKAKPDSLRFDRDAAIDPDHHLWRNGRALPAFRAAACGSGAAVSTGVDRSRRAALCLEPRDATADGLSQQESTSAQGALGGMWAGTASDCGVPGPHLTGVDSDAGWRRARGRARARPTRIQRALKGEEDGRPRAARPTDEVQEAPVEGQPEEGGGFARGHLERFLSGLATLRARSHRGGGRTIWGYSRRTRQVRGRHGLLRRVPLPQAVEIRWKWPTIAT